MAKEAYLYDKKADKSVQCLACNHLCVIPDGHRGICAVRENRQGILYSLVYEKLVAENIDPIEKKPLFHFYPGTLSLSIATMGCNFRCQFCQNADIAQGPREGSRIMGDAVTAETIVAHAKEAHCPTIAYTYTEPTIFCEYAYDVASLASQEGIKNIFVTNGFMTEALLDMFDGVLHAANVDLKCFSEKTYKDIMGGRLGPVCDTITNMKQRGIWVEVTTLVIPGLNDSDVELGAIAKFIASVSPEIPWHVNRFYPHYNYTHVAVTPIETLHQGYSIGKEAGLHYVYAGNVLGDSREHTLCHHCGTCLIERYGFTISKNRLARGTCPECNTPCGGVW